MAVLEIIWFWCVLQSDIISTISKIFVNRILILYEIVQVYKLRKRRYNVITI